MIRYTKPTRFWNKHKKTLQSLHFDAIKTFNMKPTIRKLHENNVAVYTPYKTYEIYEYQLRLTLRTPTEEQNSCQRKINIEKVKTELNLL